MLRTRGERRRYGRQRARTPKRSLRPRNNDRPRREQSRERSLRERNDGNRTVINTIAGGFGRGGPTRSARKRHLRAIRNVYMVSSQPQRSMLNIVFTDRDFKNIATRQDDPMVIAIEIANCEVRKTLVDQGSSVDILHWRTFKRMGLDENAIILLDEQIVGFSGERVDTRGYIDLYTKFGRVNRGHRTIVIRYLIVDINTSYNALLGRPSLNLPGVIVSTPHLAMKFLTERGEVAIVYADQRTTRECYAISLRLTPTVTSITRDVNQRMVALTDLDPRVNDEIRMEPRDMTKAWQLGVEGQNTQLGEALTKDEKEKLKEKLVDNKDLFAWTTDDMPSIDPRIMTHKLSVCKEARPVAQKKRRLGEEKRRVVVKEVQKLLKAGLIREIQYTTWLANIVLVKKNNGKWRMCTDYTDLNKACPKDAYPLPSIDRLVDGATGHRILSFLYAFSGYNQIPMYDRDMDKTTFITETANYCYQVMPFGLKNAGATYQRLMDQVFKGQIGRNMEVYMDDMVVKSDSFDQHLDDLTEIFAQLRRYNMRLNLSKCVFGVEGGKFLGFMLTHKGIEANPDKYEAISTMRSPTNLKEAQRLVGRLTSLSRFLPRLTEKIRPILKTLKKAEKFKWDHNCEEAFNEIKMVVSSTPILEKPKTSSWLLLHLSVTKDTVSSALVQEEG